jgi:hypothetical protein
MIFNDHAEQVHCDKSQFPISQSKNGNKDWSANLIFFQYSKWEGFHEKYTTYKDIKWIKKDFILRVFREFVKKINQRSVKHPTDLARHLQ